MSVESGIWCSCGCRITERDIRQQGFVMSQAKPMFIYLKYQCPRCHASDERLIDFEDWDSSLLRGGTEMVPGEEERVASLGPIQPEEIIDFACRVKYDGVQAVRDLADSTR